jgi:UPF0716 protein FxsA
LLLKLFLMFTLIPVIELALLVKVGSRIGVTLTIAVVLLTGASGAWLARTQGLRALVRLQEALRAVQFPGDEIFDGVLILGGGLLLLTPGFLTDLLGLSVLIPGSRHLIKAALKGTVRRRMNSDDLRVNTTYTVSDS